MSKLSTNTLARMTQTIKSKTSGDVMKEKTSSLLSVRDSKLSITTVSDPKQSPQQPVISVSTDTVT